MIIRRARTLTTAGRLAGSAAAIAVLLGAATFLIAGSPLAQAAPDESRHDRFPLSVEEMDARRAEIFASVDSNGDGLISIEEFAAADMPRRSRGGHHKRGGQHLERDAAMTTLEEDLFLALDKDADGVISREEFSREAMQSARKSTMKTRLFERADADGDGYLSPEEFPPRRLADLDTNGDGEISRDELPDRSARRAWGSSAS